MTPKDVYELFRAIQDKQHLTDREYAAAALIRYRELNRYAINLLNDGDGGIMRGLLTAYKGEDGILHWRLHNDLVGLTRKQQRDRLLDRFDQLGGRWAEESRRRRK